MKPAVFVELDLADAIAKSKAENKLLLVDAAAEWCEPCKMMDEMTWSAPKVVAALAELAICVQLDVDAKKEEAAQLKIKAMPTVVAFKDGVELDRSTGMQGPDTLLDWIRGLARGETQLQRLRRESGEKPDDVELRMRLASQLKLDGILDEATTHYVWLWKHGLEKNPAMVGIHKFLASAIADLTARHPPARAAFGELRDGRVPRLDALEAKALGEWLALNVALGDPSSTLAWYDANAAVLAKTEGEVRNALLGGLVPMLLEAKRWKDVGALQTDPLGELRKVVALCETIRKDATSGDTPQEVLEQIKAFTGERIAITAGILAKSLRAALREADAKLVEDEARKHGVEPKLEEGA